MNYTNPQGTTVHNLRDGGYNPSTGMRVDRTTRWGNPFKIGLDGDRNEVIEKHRQLLWEMIQTGHVLIAELASLDGQQLWCWCAPKACHANTLARAAEWAVDQMASGICHDDYPAICSCIPDLTERN